MSEASTIPPTIMKTPPDIKTAVTYGGASRRDQLTALQWEEPAIVVGTPGRFMDFMNSGDLVVLVSVCIVEVQKVEVQEGLLCSSYVCRVA